MTVMYGNVTYYNCNGGSGACSSCNDGWNDLAWPNLSTTGCVYNGCANNCSHACGDTVQVTNLCNNQANYIRVHDCFPRVGCNYADNCMGRTPPLADLLPAAFMAINGGSLGAGRIPAKVVC
jgi:hypothetical protein